VVPIAATICRLRLPTTTMLQNRVWHWPVAIATLDARAQELLRHAVRRLEDSSLEVEDDMGLCWVFRLMRRR
jgi:hypothetical protein